MRRHLVLFEYAMLMVNQNSNLMKLFFRLYIINKQPRTVEFLFTTESIDPRANRRNELPDIVKTVARGSQLLVQPRNQTKVEYAVGSRLDAPINKEGTFAIHAQTKDKGVGIAKCQQSNEDPHTKSSHPQYERLSSRSLINWLRKSIDEKTAQFIALSPVLLDQQEAKLSLGKRGDANAAVETRVLRRDNCIST